MKVSQTMMGQQAIGLSPFCELEKFFAFSFSRLHSHSSFFAARKWASHSIAKPESRSEQMFSGLLSNEPPIALTHVRYQVLGCLGRVGALARSGCLQRARRSQILRSERP